MRMNRDDYQVDRPPLSTKYSFAPIWLNVGVVQKQYARYQFNYQFAVSVARQLNQIGTSSSYVYEVVGVVYFCSSMSIRRSLHPKNL